MTSRSQAQTRCGAASVDDLSSSIIQQVASGIKYGISNSQIHLENPACSKGLSLRSTSTLFQRLGRVETSSILGCRVCGKFIFTLLLYKCDDNEIAIVDANVCGDP